MKIRAAHLGVTRSGFVKLDVAKAAPATATHCIIYAPWGAGFRGGNNIRGDRAPDWSETESKFLEFPGIILAQGQKADGIAGNMAQWGQWIFLLPIGKVVRLGQSGRRPHPGLYLLFDGAKLHAATWDQRTALIDVDDTTWPIPGQSPEQRQAEIDAAFTRREEARLAKEAEEAAKLADGGKRKEALRECLQAAVYEGFPPGPYRGPHYQSALEGFPLDRFPSPGHALGDADEGNWKAAEAWGQEIAAHEPGGQWSINVINMASVARKLPKAKT